MLLYNQGAHTLRERRMAPVVSVPQLMARSAGDGAMVPALFDSRCGLWPNPPSESVREDELHGSLGSRCAGSTSICRGCVLCLREDATIMMIDGGERRRQRILGYSWVVTRSSASPRQRRTYDIPGIVSRPARAAVRDHTLRLRPNPPALSRRR